MAFAAGPHGTTVEHPIARLIFRLAMVYLTLIGASIIVMLVGVNIGQNGTFDITTIGDSFVIFGGLWSFLGLIVVLAIGAGLYVGVYFLAEAGYSSHWTAAVTVVAAITGLIVGSLWIRIDLAFFGGLWPVVIYLVLLAGLTVAVAAILGNFRNIRHN